MKTGIIIICLLLLQGCATVEIEKNDEGVAYFEPKRRLFRHPPKSLSFDNKFIRKFSFYNLDTLNKRVFTYNDLVYIRKNIPNEYKKSHFEILKFDYNKNYPLFTITRAKAQGSVELNHRVLFIEIPILKLNNKVFINTGNITEKEIQLIEQLLSASFNKDDVDIMLNRFLKGIVEVPFRNTVWYRYIHFWE